MGAQGGGKRERDRDKRVGDNQVRAVVFCTTIQLPAGTFLTCTALEYSRPVPHVYFRTYAYRTNFKTICG